MKLTYKHLIFFVILAVFLFGLYFVLNSNKNEEHVVKIGYLPIYVDLPLFVAKEKGFFDKRGIKVELIRFESSPDMGTAIVNGDIDAAASIATTVALNVESRDPNKIKVFMVDAPNINNYLSSFVVLNESNIKTINQLKGHKIGGFPGPTATKFGKMVLEKNGLDPEKDFVWIELPVNTHLQALESKTVDAIFTYEPTATQAEINLHAKKILPAAVESNIINPWQAGSWIVNKKFSDKYPDESKKIILALYDALDYMRSQNSNYKEALLPYTKIDLNVANKTPNIEFTKLNEIDIKTYQKYANLHKEMGLIKKGININNILYSKSKLD